MNNNIKKYLINFILIISVALLVVFFLTRNDLVEIKSLISKISFLKLMALAIIPIFQFIITGLILKIIIDKFDKSISFLSAINLAFIGGFVSGITPSSTGGQIAQVYILKEKNLTIEKSFGVVWLDFLFFQIVFITYTFLLLLNILFLTSIKLNFWSLVIIGGFIGNFITLLLMLLIVIDHRMISIIAFKFIKILSKLKIIKNQKKIKFSTYKKIKDFHEAILLFKGEKKLALKLVILNIIRFTIQFSFPIFIIYVLDIDLKYVTLLSVISFSSFIMLANAFIPIPGAIGGTELMFVGMFALIISSSVEVTTVMLLWRFLSFYMIIIIGAIIFFFILNKIRKGVKYENSNIL